MATVFVGLSGGVDSSVSAALLKDQGHEVTGVYMKNWTADVAGVACPWQQDLFDARAAASVLDIPFMVMDFQADYKQQVVDVMVAEYRAGRTPNPDILCNQEIKFNLFLQAALKCGADYVATGHYAAVSDAKLLTAADRAKDQTYFLYRVTRGALERTLFPLAHLTKPQVRELAAKFNLPTANKPDSQGICFIGEVGIRDFLSQYIDSEPGPVLLARTGERLGAHTGAAVYTIGQRHGLGIGGGHPYYVIAKDMSQNTVYVTDDPDDLSLLADRFNIRDLHWIDAAPKPGRPYEVRTRYRADLIPAHLEPHPDGYVVTLARPERAVTAGQAAVVYDGNQVLGGGTIAHQPGNVSMKLQVGVR